MPLTLQNVPGFADVPDIALGAENPALALNLNRISQNAALGMVRPEIFYAVYLNGQTVGLPQSPVDGYQYSRSELSYIWAVQSTLSPTSGWITGPDSLWYAAWIVDQTTGNVESIEYYRRSGSHDQAQQSNDGALGVFTIAQRQAGFLSLSVPANNFTDIADSSFVVDVPLAQSMGQTLNRDAKFSVLNSEVIYMGEFIDGQTVPLPVSPCDGYAYSYSQVKFGFSWRWTTTESSFTQPDKSLGQLGEMIASVSSVGLVHIYISMIYDEDHHYQTPHFGRVAVFAFCSRNNLIGTFPAIANAFAEIDPNVLMPGTTLRASTLLQLQKNIREASCSCEFFGPTTYSNGNTVPLPTSSIDGYAYSRQEIRTIWEWSDTLNNSGAHVRTAALWGDISQTTGYVTLRNWRMPPGGPYVEDGDAYLRINVIIVASRGAQHSTIVAAGANPASDIGSAVVDNNPSEAPMPYVISYYAGETGAPATSEQILKHQIPGNLTTVTLPASLVGSYGGCVIAPTGSVAFTIKQGATTLGTMNIAAGATTATFTFAGAITLNPGDIVSVIAPASADATLKGVWFSVVGTRV